MWINRTQYNAINRENAQLYERASQLEEQMAFTLDQLAVLRAEKDALQDDVRRLIGLKPRIGATAPPQPAPPAEGDVPGANQHFQMQETPRSALLRAQREHAKRTSVEDQAAIMEAIKTYEEVLL